MASSSPPAPHPPPHPPSPPLNLYLIELPDDRCGYNYYDACVVADYYDACVVAAESDKAARMIHPASRSMDYSYDTASHTWWSGSGGWPDRIEDLKVTFLAVADPSVQRGVVLASFNEG